MAETELTNIDRCDQCGAQAYMRANFKNGEILFCSHHANQYANQIQRQAVSVHDERYKLLDFATPTE